MRSTKTRKGIFETLESRQMLSHSSVIPPLPKKPTTVDTAAFTLATNDLAVVQTDTATLQAADASLDAAMKTALPPRPS